MYEGIVFTTVLRGAENWRVREEGGISVMKCLRCLAGVTMEDKINNDVEISTGMVRKLENKIFTLSYMVRKHGEDV